MHAIFPRGPKPDAGGGRINPVNKALAAFANPNDPKRVVYIAIGAKFIKEDKTVNQELMPDTLHLNAAGFQVWADAIIETVKKQLQ